MDANTQTTTLRAEPKSMLSNDFVLFEGNTEIGLLDMKTMTEAATLNLGEETFELGREGMMSGHFFLSRNGTAIVKADKPSAFRSEFEIFLGDETVILRKAGVLSSTYEVYHGDVRLGGVAREGIMTRKATMELPADWPRPLQCFVYWLVQIMWNRDAAASAG